MSGPVPAWREFETEILAAYRNGRPLARIYRRYAITRAEFSALLEQHGLATRAEIRETEDPPGTSPLESFTAELLDVKVRAAGERQQALATLMATPPGQ
ncbi:hypothetical protein GCM10009760_16550 [Kitasatospora kazusensis]|uniref:Uncharacterized protein n=1 Tax=Kitasatospora kazusensis TaxID=407974 RepID=A0ABN2Z4W6_9ACTN